MYNPGEIPAIVASFGTNTTRVGFAGADKPQAWFPSTASVPEPPPTATAAVPSGKASGAGAGVGAGAGAASAGQGVPRGPQYGFDLSVPIAGTRLVGPMQDGLVKDWDMVEQLFRHALTSRLGLPACGDHAVMLAEPLYTPRSDRDHWAQLMFEKFQAPAVFMSKEGVLACYAHARTSGLVVDMGASATTVTPVQDGARRGLVCGNVLDEQFMQTLERRGVRITPSYAAATGATRPKVPSGLHASWPRYFQQSIVRRVKEEVFRVSDTVFSDSTHRALPAVPYTLPDGSVLDVDATRFQLPELYFDPDPIKETLVGAEPLPTTIVQSALACDIEARKDLLGNVILVGGSAGFSGLQERLQKELGLVTPAGFTSKLAAAGMATERQLGSWIGGSILSSISGFPDMWVTRAEYQDHGSDILHRKCP